jgi:uncharacterized peroxidase-related enzyme
MSRKFAFDLHFTRPNRLAGPTVCCLPGIGLSKIPVVMLLHSIDRSLGIIPRQVIRAILVVSPAAPVDILKAFYYQPTLFGTPFCAFSHAVMRGRSDWSKGEREALGAFVSDLNRCGHCSIGHCEIASVILGRAQVRDVLQNNSKQAHHEKLYAFRDFARKVTLTPEFVESNDAVVLRDAKLTDSAIVDGILIVAGFNLINRVASALHFKTPSPSDMVPSAWFLRLFGYRYLCGSFPGISRPREAIETPNQCIVNCGDRATLVASTRRWFLKLVELNRDAISRAPQLAREVSRKTECDPDTVNDSDVAHLERHGCSEDEIFNLILAAAATAALLRLEAGLRVI